MVMDLRRTCFRERWHFGQGDDSACLVDWFECPPGAQWYTEETPFRSLDWIGYDDTVPARPGPDHKRQRHYLLGETPPGYKGQQPCGPADWFSEGVPSPVAPAPFRSEYGVPLCCGVGSGVASWSGHGNVTWTAIAKESLCVQCTSFISGAAGHFYFPWVFTPRPMDGLVGAVFAGPPITELTVPPPWRLLGSAIANGLSLWLVALENLLVAQGYEVFTFDTAGPFFVMAQEVNTSQDVADSAVDAADNMESILTPVDVNAILPAPWSVYMRGFADAGGFNVAAAIAAIPDDRGTFFAGVGFFGTMNGGQNVGLQTDLGICRSVGGVLNGPAGSVWCSTVVGGPALDTASWLGFGMLSWVGAQIVGAEALWSGVGYLDWASEEVFAVPASWSGVGSLVWAGSGLVGGAASWSGVGSLFWTGAKLFAGAAAWSGTGSLSWVGSSISGPTVVQYVNANATSVNFPVATTTGNAIIVVATAYVAGSAGINAPSSPSYFSGGGVNWNSSQCHSGLFYILNSASISGTGAFVPTGGLTLGATIEAWEVSGLGSFGLDHANAAQGSSSTPTVNYTAPSQTGDYMVFGVATQGSSSWTSLTSPWVADGHTVTSFPDCFGAHFNNPTTSSGSVAVTLSGNLAFGGVVGLFKTH
jgi:hypothetical protein